MGNERLQISWKRLIAERNGVTFVTRATSNRTYRRYILASKVILESLGCIYIFTGITLVQHL